jgi:predicted HicB family RNase H-like nuclease
MIEYKGYTGVFDYDPDIETFTGHVIDLKDELYFEGDSVDELKSSMERAVDQYLEVCEKRGEDPARPFSGQLRVRMDSSLHQRAAVLAAASGLSLNALVIRALEHELGKAG